MKKKKIKKEEEERIFAQVHYLDEFVDMATHISLEGMPKKTLSSPTVKASFALVNMRSESSQTLDEWEVAFSLPLSAIRCLFENGVISSIKVAGEAVLVGSVTGAGGVTKTPFSIMHTVLFPRLEKGSFFLAFIFAYIPWLNFVVMSMKENHLLKKKKDLRRRVWTKAINTYSSSPQFL